MFSVFTTYLTPLPMLSLSSIWPLINRKNFSSPSDYHCSNSDSCLPLCPSYFCLKYCPMKLWITLHQILFCTPHPRSGQYIGSGDKKKTNLLFTSLGTINIHYWGEGTTIRKQVSFCNIQCFKTKRFNVCSGELNYWKWVIVNEIQLESTILSINN